jgi:hypothetical protein
VGAVDVDVDVVDVVDDDDDDVDDSWEREQVGPFVVCRREMIIA